MGVTQARFWNGTAFDSASTFLDANLSSDGTSWTLPGVVLDTTGSYRVRVIAHDNAGNVAQAAENPRTDFLVVPDNIDPTAQAAVPGGGNPVTAPDTIEISGTAFDASSGVSRVRVRVQQLGLPDPSFWNGTAFTGTSVFLDADLSSDGTSWTLPGVILNTAGSYRIRVIAHDHAGNIAQAAENPRTDFLVQ